MTRNRLRNAIGVALVLSHFLILLVVLFSPLYGVGPSQAFELATVIAPLFAAFTTAIIKYFVKNQVSTIDQGEQLSFGFVAIGFFLPSVFVVAILSIFLGFALDVVNITFQETKIVIGSLEVLFGVYVGIVVESLFGHLEKTPPDRTTDSK